MNKIAKISVCPPPPTPTRHQLVLTDLHQEDIDFLWDLAGSVTGSSNTPNRVMSHIYRELAPLKKCAPYTAAQIGEDRVRAVETYKD